MREGRGDFVVAVILATLASGGVAFGLVVDPEPAPPVRPSDVGFVARAVFCPPALDAARAQTAVAVGSSGGVAVPLEVEPDGGRTSLEASRFLRLRPTAGTGTSITGFGARLQAGVYGELRGANRGAAAAPCSETASSRWYFAEGSSELGDDQRLVLYNPLLDEAVMRVLFHTAKGVTAKAALADVDVPPGRAIELQTNDYVLREKLLATSVLVTRGRVVAWRTQQSDRRGSPGLELSLGAAAPRTEWYFPYGSLSRDATESIAVLNPTTEESVVTVTLATDKRVQQPPRLVEQTVPPQSAIRLSLSKRVARPRGDTELSAWVSAVNGIPVIAERTVTGSGKRSGEVTSEVGSSETASGWWLAPVVARADADRIELMNPGSSDARVALTILRTGASPLKPRALAEVEVPAGLRTSVDITRWTRGEPLAVSLEADEAVVAERWGRQKQSSDAAAAMGMPVRPNGPR